MAIKPNFSKNVQQQQKISKTDFALLLQTTVIVVLFDKLAQSGKADNNPSHVHVIFRPLLQIMILVPCITSVNGECCTGSEDGSESCKCTVKYQF